MAYVTTALGDRKSQWNLLVIPFILVFGVGLVFLAYLSIDHLQWMMASTGTLLISRPGWIGVLGIVPWCFPGFGVSFWLFNTVSSHIPFLRREFSAEELGRDTLLLAAIQRFFLKFTLISAGCAALCTILTFGTFTAVNPTGMVQHSFLGLHIKQYSWNDIVEVKATCRDYYDRSRHDLELSYFVIMSDGASADLLDNSRDAFPAIYKEIRPVLWSHLDIRRSARITESGMSLFEQWWSGDTQQVIREALFTAAGNGRLKSE